MFNVLFFDSFYIFKKGLQKIQEIY